MPSPEPVAPATPTAADTTTPAPAQETPKTSNPDDDFLQLRPPRSKPAPAAPVPAPVGPAGDAATIPGETPAQPGASGGATPEGQAPPASPADDTGPRNIKIDDLQVNSQDYVINPAPIDTSIVLNLKRMEKEPERRWSLRLAFGTGTVDMDMSLQRARLMEAFGRQAFGQISENLGESFGWSGAGPSEPSNAARIVGNVRYKLLPTITLEAQAGRSNALTDFSQPGFRFDERNEVLDISVGPLITLPFRLWRFGFFAGGGVGFIKGKQTSEVFVPSFAAAPVFLVSEATGNTAQYYLRAGGEAFVTKFISFTIEAEYRNAKIDDLKYTDNTVNSTVSARAINETDVPYVWNSFEFDFEGQAFGWLGDPNQPMEMDFTGVAVTAGLRYHF